MLTGCSPANRGTGRVWRLAGNIFTTATFCPAAQSQLTRTKPGPELRPAGQREPALEGQFSLSIVTLPWSLRDCLLLRPPPPTTTTNTVDPAAPLIQAIRSELRRFQRSQNSGVTIVTDPDLVDKESKA